MSQLIRLKHRALLILCGKDSTALLQGLVTNDIRQLVSGTGVASFLLNNKGRIDQDMIIWKRNDELVVECSSSQSNSLKTTIEKYRMRKKVDVILSNEAVYFSTDAQAEFTDPRLKGFGSRRFGEGLKAEDTEAYHRIRREQGIAEGHSELAGMLPFQANGDLLNYVSVNKGCYIGQELTARTAHTGVIRRRIVPFRCENPVAGEISDEDGRKVGEVISSDSKHGLALLSLVAFERRLSTSSTPIVPYRPAWMPPELLRSATGTAPVIANAA